MDTTKPKVIQVTLHPTVKAAGKMRADQRHLTLSGHITDLIREDADAHGVWALINREEACDD